MVEAKVIGTHVIKFFVVNKLVWSEERVKAQKLSLNRTIMSHTRTQISLSRLLDNE